MRPALQDFYNLVDVYMDAVFNPNCLKDPLVFQQEGWHYELDNKDDAMTFKGVVFNEMKGVYSQPDSIHQEAIQVSPRPCPLEFRTQHVSDAVAFLGAVQLWRNAAMVLCRSGAVPLRRTACATSVHRKAARHCLWQTDGAA